MGLNIWNKLKFRVRKYLRIIGKLTDILDRGPFLSAITQIVETKIMQKKGYSFAIDGEWAPELSACALEKCDERPRRPLHPLPESLQTPWRIRPATRTVKIV